MEVEQLKEFSDNALKWEDRMKIIKLSDKRRIINHYLN